MVLGFRVKDQLIKVQASDLLVSDSESRVDNSNISEEGQDVSEEGQGWLCKCKNTVL